MRKKILGFVFAAALLAALAVPLFGGDGTALAANRGSVTTARNPIAGAACQDLANGSQTAGTTNPHFDPDLSGLHTAHSSPAPIAGTNC